MPPMDRQEKHRQDKEKEREQRNKSEGAYEAQAEKDRPPVNAVWLIVVGIALVAFVLCLWIAGFVRPW